MKPNPVKTKADAEAQEEQIANKRIQARQAYARLFSSPDGKVVLADLMEAFGWREGVELPCYKPGINDNDSSHRDGMKEPVRRILRMSGLGIVIENKNPNEK